ncbi:response regulator transcription factor [Dactylosporangium sp. AC04546]|uniref:response regulator n=1 Tax=Dactylosporangium sp. AC04546 TaxID=2862460 RepID=UPI001EDF112C|nr:response regulator transcription factor [Dactylosporangium sp. AC04546]WVK88368.1 response regulator transcription factor [Dactylosporangium sp. AC04546]
MTIRVLLADDEAMVRAGLRLLIDSEPDLTVAGEAADGAEAVAVAERIAPDVVLMDIRMPKVDGIEAARRIIAARPQARVIMLTTFREDRYLQEALRAGVSGFLLKVSPPQQLVDAVRIVADGGGLLDPSVTLRVIEAFAGQAARAGRPDRAGELAQLSPRELDVLALVVRGMSNAEIAARLHIGEATVKTHVANFLTKLGLRDRVQAVAFAYESGLVRPGEPDP